MTVLTGEALRKRLEANDLVIRPLLEPEEQIDDTQASIDLRLGCQFAFMAPSAIGAVDEMSASDKARMDFAHLYAPAYIPLGQSLVLHPHQFVLATTLEYMRLPADLMAYVVGRSTWGRLGLIVATAVQVHPLFAGCLTLELRNLGEAPLTLYPGQTIVQLAFHQVDGTGHKGRRAKPQYSGTTNLIPRRISKKGTLAALKKLKARREGR